ncbi:FAD-dependent oxidoreductase [Halomonas sp. KM-1]|uniref:flavin monoamine oxidase family protein n=1 Tax=Halomonas sp. KM-1 TaxID=590061 RepID=UPI000287D2FC|nr:FAD-dependent oxidoreductase [Halomonas sp. KM-1]
MQLERDGETVDVIVVGAGLAGLSAARELEAAGLSCQVLEAQETPGGRVRSSVGENGHPMEDGAQFLNRDMTALVELVHEAGLELVAGGAEGETAGLGSRGFIEADTWLNELSDAWPGLVSSAGLRSGRSDRTVTELIRKVTADPQGLALMQSSLCELLCHAPSELSAQAVLGIFARYDSAREDGEYQVAGSLDALVAWLAEGLSRAPRYDTAVTAVTRGAADGKGGFDVITPTGAYRAAVGVILAVPPLAAREIELPPPLADELRPALESFVPGAMVKTTLVYRRAFWRQPSGWGRAAPLSEIVCLEPMGTTLMDTTKPGEESARLTLFTGGHRARDLALADRGERRAYAIEMLAGIFGEDEAGQPLDFTDAVWVQHPWCGGGYNAHVRFGGLPDAAARLRQVEGGLQFACSEIAERFPGYMEGALSAGKSAAARLIRTRGSKT